MPGSEFFAYEISRKAHRKLRSLRPKTLGKDVVVVEVGGYSLRADQVAKRVARECEVAVQLGLVRIGTAATFKSTRPVFAYRLRGKDIKIISLDADHPVMIRRWLYDYQ